MSLNLWDDYIAAHYVSISIEAQINPTAIQGWFNSKWWICTSSILKVNWKVSFALNIIKTNGECWFSYNAYWVTLNLLVETLIIVICLHVHTFTSCVVLESGSTLVGFASIQCPTKVLGSVFFTIVSWSLVLFSMCSLTAI